MIDTHTHLYAEEFDEDRKEVIQRALDKGITEFYLPAIDSESLQPDWQLHSTRLLVELCLQLKNYQKHTSITLKQRFSRQL